MQKRRLLFAMLLCAFWLVGFAQSAIKGTVKDKNGEPLIGVSVTFGNGQGTVTDIDGNFSVNAPAGSTIKFSYVGYKPQTLKGSGNMNITMEEDNTTLEDVVVVGYGTMKRRDLTGAVASVTGEKLAANPVANVAQALQGQLPGVNVISQDGRPGGSISIRVRGGGSITQSNDPLFIVDGVQVSSIDDIPADNIESIDVLKDAASTAIYGARGANGVILVTTKTGQEGKVSVKYNVYVQAKAKPKLLEVTDAYDMVYNTWAYSTAYNASQGQDVAKYYGLGTENGNHLNEYRNVSAHNYVDDILKNSTTWNHDISLSGGNDRTKIFATINYLNDDGIRRNSGFKRWNANVKLVQKVTKNFTADFDIRYTEMTIKGNHFSNATSAYTYRPIDTPLGIDDPTLLGMGSQNVEPQYNPVAANDQYFYQRDRQRLQGKVGLTWIPVKGLTAKSELSLSRNWTKAQTWDGGLVNGGVSSAKLEQGDGYNVRWATTLNYEVQGLGEDHTLSFLVGNEVLSNKSTSSSIYGQGFPDGFTMDNAFGMITMNDHVNDSYNYTINTPNHTNSWFGRANYNYLGRYLLTATFRADGSSKFAPNKHWGYFPAVAAAWRISDEPFLKDAQASWLDNLKLRLSIGTSGSDNISSSLWKETWTTKDVKVDGNTITTYVPGDMMPNDDLKWETTISRNLGIDFGFLNRIRGSVEFYWNTTKDILMQVPVDASTGYAYQYQNVGETSNKGIELSLAVDIIKKKDFKLDFNMTYNYNVNKVEKLNDNALADTHTGWGSTMRLPYYDYIIRVGEPVGTINGYQSMGYFTTDDFDYDAATGKYTLKSSVTGVATAGNFPATLLNLAADGKTFPGAPKFQDADGDGEADEAIIGHIMPKHTGGFNINANYKGFDFSAGFTYQLDGKVYNANAMHTFMGNKDTGYGQNRLSYAADAYKYYDIDASGNLVFDPTPATLARLNAGTKYGTFFSEYGICSSEFIESAAYLRLNTLTLGYTIPKHLIKKIGLSNLRVYFTGGNLFCISGYSGLDPDVNTSSSTGGFPTPGYDYEAYPKARTFTFGLNVAF